MPKVSFISFLVHPVGIGICLFSLPIYLNARSDIRNYFNGTEHGIELYSINEEPLVISWEDISGVTATRGGEDQEFDYVCFKLDFSLRKNILHGRVRGLNRNKLEILPDCSGSELRSKVNILGEKLLHFKNEPKTH